MKTRTRTALAAAALAVLLTASGCTAPAPEPTVTVTVTPTQAAPAPTPTVEPTEEPAPEPDPDAYTASDIGTWVVSFAGIGPLTVGDTLASVQSAVQTAPATCRPGVDTYDLDGVGFTAVSGIDVSDPSAPVQVVRMLADGVSADAPQPRTAEGIGLGSTIAELQAARPDATAMTGANNSTYYAVLADGRSITFEDFGTGTIQIISVVEGVGVASEYCGA